MMTMGFFKGGNGRGMFWECPRGFSRAKFPRGGYFRGEECPGNGCLDPHAGLQVSKPFGGVGAYFSK